MKYSRLQFELLGAELLADTEVHGAQEKTLVFDVAEDQQVLWLTGYRALPVGTVIEMGTGDDAATNRFDAVVCGMGLLAGTVDHPRTLCLDV